MTSLSKRTIPLATGLLTALLCAAGCEDASLAQEQGAPGTISADVAPAESPSQAQVAGSVGDGSDIDVSGLDCYKLTAHAPGNLTQPYAVGAARDSYVNFTFKAPWTGVAYAKVFRPIIGNKQAIHHWLLYQDSLPGGGPNAITPSSGAHPGSQLLNGWAPGGEATNLMVDGMDVAQELPGNVSYTLEVHYNSSVATATDASGVEICVAKQKPANLAGLSWLGFDQLGIPAQKWTGTCRPTSRQPIQILGVSPHMHKQGTHMKAIINRANGTKETLHDAPFDFEYQRQYNKRVTLNPGDSITTECTFAKPMAFGESTTQEMCYLFTLAYPKGALSDGGLWGTIAHGGSSCLGQ